MPSTRSSGKIVTVGGQMAHSRLSRLAIWAGYSLSPSPRRGWSPIRTQTVLSRRDSWPVAVRVGLPTP